MIHAVGADWSLLSLCSAQLSSPVSEVRITTGWTFHKHTLSWRKRLAGSFAFLLQQKWHWRRCVQELYYVITGSAASSHMRLDASGVCHEEMWAYSGGPAAVCLHCSVRCNCSSHTHSSLFTGLQLHSSCHSVSLLLISLSPAAGVTAHRSDLG